MQPRHYGIGTGREPVEGCFMCPDASGLAFEPIKVEGVEAYVIPGSMPVSVDVDGQLVARFVPLPNSAILVPFDHPRSDPGGYGHTFPDNWTEMERRLLPHTGLPKGADYSLHSQIGPSSGARIPPRVLEQEIPPHPFKWLVWGREGLRETSSTAELGFATIVYNSRVRMGTLPPPREMLEIWDDCVRRADGQAQALERFSAAMLAWV